jgi:hypothetical protein
MRYTVVFSCTLQVTATKVALRPHNRHVNNVDEDDDADNGYVGADGDAYDNDSGEDFV